MKQVLSKQVIEDLKNMVGNKNLKVGNLHESIEEGINHGNLDADIIISPDNTDQLARIIEYCNHNTIEVIPHGGRTGLSGGALSHTGQLIVQTSKLNKIIDLDFTTATATVESGVILEALENAISSHDYTLGIDLAARGSATIGGMVSTNAGGTQAFRNGTMRHRILGLEAVLPNGKVLSEMKKVIKANEGYDIKQLMIGAEGTLGIITKVVLDLLPKNISGSTALLSCKNAQSAAQMFQRLRADSSCQLLSAEIMWPLYAKTTAQELKFTKLLSFIEEDDGLFVLIEFSAEENGDSIDRAESILANLLDNELISNALIAKNAADAKDFWAIREESFLCDKKYPHGYWFDISVPLNHLDTYTENLFEKIKCINPNLKVFLFGHLGDGNLHLTVSSGHPCPGLESQINTAVYEDLNNLGGSFSAEHGIGNQKILSLEKYADPLKLEVMRAVKTVIDPNGIMNPGKVINANTL